MENKPTIIALVGPESSGKTTLANQLAVHFGAELVAEFAREYIDTLNRPYTKEDVTFIAKQQVESENRAIKSGNAIIICDTDVLVVKVWRVVKWGDTDSLVENYFLPFGCLLSGNFSFYVKPIQKNKELSGTKFSRVVSHMVTIPCKSSRRLRR
jgi:Ni2+-binding GTPase involved in maturation of urease and hydrogenase